MSMHFGLCSVYLIVLFLWIPLRNSGGKRSVAGWNDGTQTLKADAIFWYRVWSEAGCLCSGVLFEIKDKAKRKFKYAVRSLQRQKRFIIRRKLAYKLAHCPSRDFWAEVGRLSKPERRSSPHVVDGVTGDKQIATLWANKLKMLYNTHSTMLRDKIRKTLIESCSPGQLFEISVTIEDVIESIIIAAKIWKKGFYSKIILCLLIILNLRVVLCLILYLISLPLF